MKILYIVSSILLLLFISACFRNKRAKNKTVRIIADNCTGCCRCLKKCRRKVLDAVKDETGLRVEVKYPEKCTACGDCVAGCKFKALVLVNRS